MPNNLDIDCIAVGFALNSGQVWGEGRWGGGGGVGWGCQSLVCL